MTRTSILNVAIVGLGADWSSRYLRAFKSLTNRIRVVAIFDPTLADAHSAAAEFGAEGTSGLLHVLQRLDLDAIALLNVGWQRGWTVQQCIAAERPLFVGTHALGLLKEVVDRSDAASAAEGGDSTALIVPERLLAFHPSTLRLRELLVTELGHVTNVTLDVQHARRVLDPQLSPEDLLGWLESVVEINAPTACVIDHSVDDGISTLDIEVMTQSGLPLRVQLRASDSSAMTTPANAPRLPFCTMECERGRIELISPAELAWTRDEVVVEEKLDADRTATEVLLDLFARRALGESVALPQVADSPSPLSNLIAATTDKL